VVIAAYEIQYVEAGQYDRSRGDWPVKTDSHPPNREDHQKIMAITIPVRQLLLLRPSALGDVCRTVPVAASLKAHWPEAEIHWVVQTAFAAVIESHPAVTSVIRFPREQFRGGAFRPHRWWGMLGWLRSLRRGQWDVAIDCQGLARTGLMLAACGARVRVGDRAAREGAWIPCTNRVTVPEGAHEVDRMLSLLKPLGVDPVRDTRLYVPADARQEWLQAAGGRPSGPCAVFATTSRWETKAWPGDCWAELGERLVAHGQVRWIALPGAASERPQVARTAAALRERGVEVVDYAGRTDLGQLMAMIESAAITISNDSAALHMAMGLGERCLGLFGPTDPAKVGPWRRPDLAVRAPLEPGEAVSFRDRSIGETVMRRLSVDTVCQRAIELLESWSR
jgi:lipopolysaccharide heptosyltransferase I